MRIAAEKHRRSILFTILIAGAVLASQASVSAQNATPPGGAIDFGALDGEIAIDGSSTVWPIVDEAAARFLEQTDDVQIALNISGTGGGFSQFCRGQTDIQNASRPIDADEAQQCADEGIEYVSFDVGLDGITVVVSPKNDFVNCLTVDQLKRLWQHDDPAESWQDLDPSWPDEKIELFGPGPQSGTYDFFTEQILGEVGASRTDYVPSESDFVLVDGVADEENGLAFFGFAYYEGAADELKFVSIDAGNGCVAPSPETIADGTYAPLSRPLSIYVNKASLARPEVEAFLRFSLESMSEIVSIVGYIPLDANAYANALAELEAAITG